MATGTSRIDFKNPRQKQWGVIKNGTLAQLNYGYIVDESGNPITSYYTNCYEDVLDQVHDLLAAGTGVYDIQAVEFVPYDYTMQPVV
ncbi:hypothetical protein ACMXKO_11010 [Clostridium tyrobutyricum]|uniref:hypothetical protein n=1 Tax=Clostridium tyrobutyricum TaxID=1519 RepID=UPI0039F6587D